MGTRRGNPSSFMVLKEKKKCILLEEMRMFKKNPAFHTKKIDLEYKDVNNNNTNNTPRYLEWCCKLVS